MHEYNFKVKFPFDHLLAAKALLPLKEVCAAAVLHYAPLQVRSLTRLHVHSAE
jgi:hypothetical protein